MDSVCIRIPFKYELFTKRMLLQHLHVKQLKKKKTTTKKRASDYNSCVTSPNFHSSLGTPQIADVGLNTLSTLKQCCFK